MLGFLYIAFPLVLLVIGYVVGSATERKHIRSLDRREAQYAHILCTNLKEPYLPGASQPAFVDGQAVIGSDYFKTFAMGLRSFFGGEVRSMQTLMSRARREATLRMLEKADARGASMVYNIRLETSTIGRGKGRRGIPTAEIYAYGTAIRLDPAA